MVEMSTEWFKQRLILDMVTNFWPLFDILKLWSAFDAGGGKEQLQVTISKDNQKK